MIKRQVSIKDIKKKLSYLFGSENVIVKRTRLTGMGYGWYYIEVKVPEPNVCIKNVKKSRCNRECWDCMYGKERVKLYKRIKGEVEDAVQEFEFGTYYNNDGEKIRKLVINIEFRR